MNFAGSKRGPAASRSPRVLEALKSPVATCNSFAALADLPALEDPVQECSFIRETKANVAVRPGTELGGEFPLRWRGLVLYLQHLLRYHRSLQTELIFSRISQSLPWLHLLEH